MTDGCVVGEPSGPGFRATWIPAHSYISAPSKGRLMRTVLFTEAAHRAL